MKIIYRISDAGYNKVKPAYINNEACLKNFCNVFFDHIYDILVIADNCSDDTITMIKKYIDPVNIRKVSVGHGAGTFNLALDEALRYDDLTTIYFVENDYIHLHGSPQILKEGFNLGASYMTLYLHPDKFIPPHQGGNPEVDYDGGYMTRIYKGETQLFGIFNSTTMTFASKVKTLKEDESILRKWTNGTHPNDFQMFLELRDKGSALLCPLNTFSTHGETAWLAPLYKTKQENLIEEWKKHL
jgi:glycosyltransferase involved in cell wall biosynthesis